jgi:RNA polymerase sigma factor (sigma-70 family)
MPSCRIDVAPDPWHNCKVKPIGELSIVGNRFGPVAGYVPAGAAGYDLNFELISMQQQPSDASLVFAAARSRDGDAMSEIVRRYGQLVYSVGRRIAGGDEPAHEIARQTLTELAHRPHRVRGELSAWLHNRAVRLASQRYPTNGNGHAHRDPAEEPRWEEIQHDIDPALSRLKHKHRHIIIQHYFQRHSQDELAEMLQVNQPIVAKRLRAALEAMRSELVRRGSGCSLAQLMMLLARHGESEAPPKVVDDLVSGTAHQLANAPPRRGRWLAVLAVWSVIAGMITAVAMSYSGGRGDTAKAPSSRPAQR